MDIKTSIPSTVLKYVRYLRVYLMQLHKVMVYYRNKIFNERLNCVYQIDTFLPNRYNTIVLLLFQIAKSIRHENKM